jgi:hypothetical protein
VQLAQAPRPPAALPAADFPGRCCRYQAIAATGINTPIAIKAGKMRICPADYLERI